MYSIANLLVRYYVLQIIVLYSNTFTAAPVRADTSLAGLLGKMSDLAGAWGVREIALLAVIRRY
jgi:hypothetical protein